ncbi:unnamed protein product, partial [Prunus brigantina]
MQSKNATGRFQAESFATGRLPLETGRFHRETEGIRLIRPKNLNSGMKLCLHHVIKLLKLG